MANTLDERAPALAFEPEAKGNSPDIESEEKSIPDVVTNDYSKEEYARLKRKIDRYLLPLMWLCYGIQQTDKTSISTQAVFGLREDTHLQGQQYSWLTTIFYLCYMCFEFPSNLLLQRYKMGRTLSIYMIGWGIIVLSIGFAQNFTQLIVLRGLQGLFECCISPGFILVVGTWYKRGEHTSRTLFFQSANAGFGIIGSLALYGIGTLQYSKPDIQAWRAMSYFLGGFTIVVGILCLFLLGTPSEVKWLTEEERKMANTRVLANQSGHDTTGVKTWKWNQVREALVDPCFYFAGLNAFLSSVPNGGLTSFGTIINKNFGFTNLQVILIEIPRNVTTILYFITVALITTRYKDLRLYFMGFSVIPPFIGFLMMSLLPNDQAHKWSKWAGYYITFPFTIAMFLGWTLIPSNTPGRTKRTITSSFTFVGYCVGNMVGSQIFRDPPKYTKGTIGCALCFGIEFFVIAAWRTVLVLRNRRRDREAASEGITEADRARLGKENGQKDMSDFENPHFRYTL